MIGPPQQFGALDNAYASEAHRGEEGIQPIGMTVPLCL
jgi:hypothetical protein